MVMTALCFIGYSAYCSYHIYDVRQGSVDLSPAFLTDQILKYEDKVRSNILYLPFKPALNDKYLFSESLFITVADSRAVLFHGVLMNIRKIPCGFPIRKA